MNSIVNFFVRQKMQILIFLLIVITPIGLTLWWWGAFNTPLLYESTSRGPYHYAYIDHEGDYAYIADHQLGVLGKLEEQGVRAGASIIIMESDPRNTKRKQRKARVGYLIPNDVKTLKNDVKIGDIPKRNVVLVTAKTQILLAPSIAYTKLVDYIKQNNIPLKLPTVEIYEDKTFHLEMEH